MKNEEKEGIELPWGKWVWGIKGFEQGVIFYGSLHQINFQKENVYQMSLGYFFHTMGTGD